jgi:methyltransferase (TIGR00027 family)
MPPVTQTARWAAAQRARESERVDRLFADPLAAVLAGDEGFRALEISEKLNPRHEQTAAYIAVRVRFLDDFLLRMVSEGHRQVVLLGAGMDARAFRLELPAETTVYELDHPELLALKEELLRKENARPVCHRVVLANDLHSGWAEALLRAGFSASRASIWILEGLLYYLGEAEVHDLLRQIAELAASASALGADLVSKAALNSPRVQTALKRMENAGFPWKFATDDPEELFRFHGWEARARQLGEDGANFGRWKPPVWPRAQREIPRTFLVAARRAAPV